MGRSGAAALPPSSLFIALLFIALLHGLVNCRWSMSCSSSTSEAAAGACAMLACSMSKEFGTGESEWL